MCRSSCLPALAHGYKYQSNRQLEDGVLDVAREVKLTSRDTQHLLNQPFPFQEVLLSPKERSRIQKGPIAGQLFNTEPGRIEVTDYRLRELSVRLRTINNACDAQASLPDGLPITEVSLYGSRDRQYVVGPYAAVKRLMAGEAPTKEDALGHIEEISFQIADVLENLSRWQEEVAPSDAKAIVVASSGIVSLKRELGLPVLRPRESRTVIVGRHRDSFRFSSKDREALAAAHESLTQLVPALQSLQDEVNQWKQWWTPWTDASRQVVERADSILALAKQALVRLYEQGRASVEEKVTSS